MAASDQEHHDYQASENHEMSHDSKEDCHQSSAPQAQCGMHCTHSSIFIDIKSVDLPIIEAQDLNNLYVFFHTKIYLEGLFRPPLV